MTRRDWWLGIAVVVLTLLLHAAVPRYEWRTAGRGMLRIDRWTGQAFSVWQGHLLRLTPEPSMNNAILLGSLSFIVLGLVGLLVMRRRHR
jgi:hypothetical protein